MLQTRDINIYSSNNVAYEATKRLTSRKSRLIQGSDYFLSSPENWLHGIEELLKIDPY